MKRHESMIALSRDHHFGLLFCWKLRRGIKKNIALDRMQLYVQYFWNNHLKQHFEDEETLLFPTLIEDDLCMQAVSHHEKIRKLIENINSLTIKIDQLNLLADTMDQHIRFEERIFFPRIESLLSENTLVNIGKYLNELHEMRKTDNYTDEFWV